MPSRVRNRVSKTLKENIGVSVNNKKCTKSTTKGPRKALADKTNSVSDDNISDEIPTKTKKVVTKSSNEVHGLKNEGRPRRDRRLPSRFVGNQALTNPSNGKANNVTPDNAPTSKTGQTQTKVDSPLKSTESSTTFKTPVKIDSSILEHRPRRICRLPSRFDDHSVSPNKYIPIQPANASTPIQSINNKAKLSVSKNEAKKSPINKGPVVLISPLPKSALQKKANDNSSEKSSPDTNNNGRSRTRRVKKTLTEEAIKKSTPKPTTSKTTLNKSSSLEVSLESKKALKTPDQKQIKPKRKVITKNVAEESLFEITLESEVSNRSLPKETRPKRKIVDNKPLNKSSSFEMSPESKKVLNTPTETVKPKKTIVGKRVLRQSSLVEALNKQKSLNTSKTRSPKKVHQDLQTNTKRIIDNDYSFKVLGKKKQLQDEEKDDIYEFTFDPNEEPKPQKKKRKKTVTKKPAKPKTVTYKSAYERNISRALNALKNSVKPSTAGVAPKLAQIQEINDEITQNNTPVSTNVGNVNTTHINKSNNITAGNDVTKNSVHECNYPSIRVEDIAADIEPTVMDDHHNDICYSPVYSPEPRSPANSPHHTPKPTENNEKPAITKDPLNLQENLSFFDDVPVASSSMNASVRHPLASPWRVEFGSLPIKWHVNAYVKPNMTPAVETSFISAEDSGRKKHVYTNIVPDANDSLPQIVSNTPNYKQTSIISFIREQAEKSARKKRGRTVSPRKANAIFDDLTNTNVNSNSKKIRKITKEISKNVSENETNSTNDTSSEKENSKEGRKLRKRKNNENICDLPAKSPRKQKDGDVTFFGFDDSENQDSENISPIKINPKSRSLRPRSRPVLQEFNGPSRAALPVAAKSKTVTSSEAVNKVYEELKSAADAPMFPENNVDEIVTNVEDPTFDDDSESVHLFEDIEFIHHLKPSRKSYGKGPKKVTFQQQSTSDNDSNVGVPVQNESSDEDDLADLTFEVPNVQEKKKAKKRKPKKLMSKKEEKEAEEWAAGFNSMCEDIEEFPLLIE